MSVHLRFIKFTLIASVVLLTSCNPGNDQKTAANPADSALTQVKDSSDSKTAFSDTTTETAKTKKLQPKAEQPAVLIYSFHVTNRCPGCIAIENATKKTLDTYFKTEVSQNRIKLSVLNVDDKANKDIAEKYQAFGSGLFVTRIFKGKETTADLTGDGFKYAKNKEEKFIEILKNKITEYLK